MIEIHNDHLIPRNCARCFTRWCRRGTTCRCDSSIGTTPAGDRREEGEGGTRHDLATSCTASALDFGARDTTGTMTLTASCRSKRDPSCYAVEDHVYEGCCSACDQNRWPHDKEIYRSGKLSQLPKECDR